MGNPTDEQLIDIYHSAKNIAVVGLSSNFDKDSNRVARYLQEQEYNVIPVNPTADEILGQKAYPDLLSIPEKVDVVDIFRPSDEVMPHVEQAIQIGANVVWMQLGIVNEEAAKKTEDAGLEVVMDRCMRVEHLRLINT